MSENAEQNLNDEQLKKDFPSTELAYPIALASYETLSKRNDAIDNKIQNALTVAVSFFVAIISLAKIKELSFKSNLFYVSSGFMVISVVINLYARIHGSLKTINPGIYLEDWINREHTDFQIETIYHAGQHYESNNRMIRSKWKFHVVSIICFLIAITLLVLWVSRPI